jgi:hypothetical protein
MTGVHFKVYRSYSRKAFREVRGLEKKYTLKIDRERERERK